MSEQVMSEYKLMPKQITKEMADAFWEEYSKDKADDLLTRCYKAMLAAAPTVKSEPVSAQVRYRRPEKGLPGWSDWQQAEVDETKPTYHFDEQGWEVEYRLLYTTPQLAKQGEPVGWYTEDHLDDKSATTYKAEVAQRWRDKGWPVWPLFTAPQPTEHTEPVGWQFYQDGKWWNGDDRIKDHRKNTVAAGVPVRDVYATPQSIPDVTQLVEALRAVMEFGCDHKSNRGRWALEKAESALSAYRKGVQI